MSVKLVSYTKPVLDGLETPVDLLSYIARVSNPDNQMNTATGGKLLKSLIRMGHWSPLEMVDATIEIEAPRDISRQIIRHRSMSVQEFSQRYAEALGFSEPRECRLQDVKNRQNSLPCLDPELTGWWERVQREILASSNFYYQMALKKGIAKECARVILPEGLTMSRMYLKGSLRSWIHYLQSRTDVATQAEHRAIAVIIAGIIADLFHYPELLAA